MKDIEFDVELTAKDLYRFSMRHTYSGVSGIFWRGDQPCMLDHSGSSFRGTGYDGEACVIYYRLSFHDRAAGDALRKVCRTGETE